MVASGKVRRGSIIVGRIHHQLPSAHIISVHYNIINNANMSPLLQFLMALFAVSASTNSQKPNPLGFPVSRSNINLTSQTQYNNKVDYLKLTTGPTSLKMSMICSSVISKGMFPTKTTLDMANWPWPRVRCPPRPHRRLHRSYSWITWRLLGLMFLDLFSSRVL